MVLKRTAYHTTLLVLLTFVIGAHGFLLPPDEPEKKNHNCGTPLSMAADKESELMHQRDIEMKGQLSTRAGGSNNTFPVVFHVIHNNGPENISDAKIREGLQNLNDAFANEGYYNQNTGVPVGIDFCLSIQNPDQDHTNGITRTESVLATFDMEVLDVELKNLSRWPPRAYINIWIVKEILNSSVDYNVVGYSSLPSSHGSLRDGIVVESRLFDSQEETAILVHEMGHYLGLYHTYRRGCANDDCETDGDAVCDTPPDNSAVILPCDLEINSCSTDADSWFANDRNDLSDNYMDYIDLGCHSAFTDGQKTRMCQFAVMERSSLSLSKGCTEPCLPKIVANDLLLNYRTTLGTPLIIETNGQNAKTITWYLDGQRIYEGEKLNYFFDEIGDYELTVSLKGNNSDCELILTTTVTVTCDVMTSFASNANYFYPGDQGAFSNTSENHSSQKWSMNGSPMASDDDIWFDFDTVGIYRLCLEATNGSCSDEQCKSILVVDSIASCRVFSRMQVGWDGDVLDLEIFEQGCLALCVLGGHTSVVYFDLQFNKLWSFGLGTVSGTRHKEIVVQDQNVYVLLYKASSVRVINVDVIDRYSVWDKTFVYPSEMYSVSDSRFFEDRLVIQDSFSDSLNIRRVRQLMLHNKTGFVLSASIFQSELSLSPRANYVVENKQLIAGINEQSINLTKLDRDNVREWSYNYNESDSLGNWSYPITILESDNGFLIAGNTGESDNWWDPKKMFLQFVDPDGTFVKRYIYRLSDGADHSVMKVLPSTDGFIAIGNLDGSVYVASIDAEGKMISAFTLPTTLLGDLRDAESIGPYLFLSGSAYHSGGTDNPFVINLKLPLSKLSSCENLIPVSFEQSEVVLTEESLAITRSDFEVTVTERSITFDNKFIRTRGFCDAVCEEICGNGIDDNDDGITDCEDPLLAETCCCLPVKKLDLGPDQNICKNDASFITAPFGFDSYLWSDGSEGTEIEVSSEGMYWLIAQDSCNVYKDTVLITLDDDFTINLGRDTSFCRFTQKFSVPGYDSYNWYQNGESLACTDCSEMQIDLKYGLNDIVLIGTSPTGCVEVDSILLELQVDTVFYELNICDNQEIPFLDGVTYDMGGRYLTKQTDDQGCDSFVDLLVTEAGIYVPNTFSLSALYPDNIFLPQVLCPVDDYVFEIYDRWGSKVYRTSGSSEGWNGRIGKYNAQQGVYTYMMTFRLEDYNTNFRKAGMLTIIK